MIAGGDVYMKYEDSRFIIEKQTLSCGSDCDAVWLNPGLI